MKVFEKSKRPGEREEREQKEEEKKTNKENTLENPVSFPSSCRKNLKNEKSSKIRGTFTFWMLPSAFCQTQQKNIGKFFTTLPPYPQFTLVFSFSFALHVRHFGRLMMREIFFFFYIQPNSLTRKKLSEQTGNRKKIFKMTVRSKGDERQKN